MDEFGPFVDRAGWTIDTPWATYEPVPGGWSARVRLVEVPGHTYTPWHIALRDGAGQAPTRAK